MKKTIALFSLMSISLMVFASNHISLPQRSSDYLLVKMAEKNFPGNPDSPGAYFVGKINCSEQYSDPGNHASGYVACAITKISAGSKQGNDVIFVPSKTSNYLIELMSKNEFPGNPDSPGAYFVGKINCSEQYSDPGNHSSRFAVCVVSK